MDFETLLQGLSDLSELITDLQTLKSNGQNSIPATERDRLRDVVADMGPVSMGTSQDGVKVTAALDAAAAALELRAASLESLAAAADLRDQAANLRNAARTVDAQTMYDFSEITIGDRSALDAAL